MFEEVNSFSEPDALKNLNSNWAALILVSSIGWCSTVISLSSHTVCLCVPCTSIIFNNVFMSSSACLLLYPFSSPPVSLNSPSAWGKSRDFRVEGKILTFAQNVKTWWSATPIILQSLLKACLLYSCYYLHCGLQLIMNTRGSSYLAHSLKRLVQ